MVFVEFTPDPSQSPSKWYFVGRELIDISRDTNGFREFAGVRMLTYREVSRQEIDGIITIESLACGIRSIQGGFPVFNLQMRAKHTHTA